MLSKILNWQDPLQTAYSLACNNGYRDDWAFLYSALSNQINNSYSYLAAFPKKQITANNFEEFEQQLKNNKSDDYWFGYLAYDLKNILEKLPYDEKFLINLPDLWMINFNLILIFDHKKQKIKCLYSNDHFLKNIPKPLKTSGLKTSFTLDKIKSNFTKDSYLKKLQSIKQKIAAGDIYQANLTRKFYSHFIKKPENDFELFIKLNKISPANYSAFLKIGNSSVISSSPELFVKIDSKGQMLCSPIKGTAPRFGDLAADKSSKAALKNSAKERAENLMIVDLIRNDFSKSCKTGSVKTKNLFKVNSYKTVHHMSSDIYGVKDDKISTIQAIKNCFPAGSMTGAPKIRAMQICSNMETVKRGIYSGAIGFFKGNNVCNLSVVIRTLIIQESTIEFQVGGAITFDSDPESEWLETINKAKGIAGALKIKISDLKKL